MPRPKTIERAKSAARAGKPATTQAGEFVREEMENLKRGKKPPVSRKQAIAIGLSKARRAGVPLEPPEPGEAPEPTRQKAKRDLDAGRRAPRVRGTAPRKSRRTRKAAQKSRTAVKTASRGPVRKKRATKRAAVPKKQRTARRR